MTRALLCILLLVVVAGSAGIRDAKTNKTAMKPDSTAASKPVTLFLCGDVMTGRGIDQALPRSVDPALYEDYVKDARKYVEIAEQANGEIPQPMPYEYVWGDAMEKWDSADVAVRIINLETAVTTHSTPWPGKGINYRMHPDNIELLTTAGIDICVLANNHTLDWQQEGMLETTKTLREAGIRYAGAGADLFAAARPAMLKTHAGRIIVLAYGMESSGIPADWQATTHRPGVNFLPNLSTASVDEIARQTDTLRQPGDIIIFSIHWGGNWGYDIPSEHRQFAHQLIDSAGVDIVHGHSSHHPKGLEVYNDKLIIYGAGDFINDYEGIGGHEQYRDDLTLMYFPMLDPQSGNLQSLKMFPMQIRNFRLSQPGEGDREWLHGKLDRESRKLGTQVHRSQDALVVE